jgi:transcription initiation factor TFIID subunit TAF12
MPALLESLNIADGSNLAIMMSRTVGQCEAQEQQQQQQQQGKQTRQCVTSLEGMKTFVGSNLPKDKRIAALQRSSSIPGTPIATPSSHNLSLKN